MKRLIFSFMLISSMVFAQEPGDTLNASIAALQAQIDQLDTSSADFDTRLAAIEQGLIDLKLQQRLAEIENLNTQQQSDIAALEARIAALESTPTPPPPDPEPEPVCGDGDVDRFSNDGLPLETCDTINLNGESCESLGFVSGILSCFPPGHENECTFDTSTCIESSVPPTPDPDPSPVASNFEDRCNQPGVVLCNPLDTEAAKYRHNSTEEFIEWVNEDGTVGVPTFLWWNNTSGIQNKAVAEGIPGAELPHVVEDIKASGTGSLRFAYPGNSSSGSGGLYTTNFSRDLQTIFVENSTFFVQFRIRYSCDQLYLDCDPSSPGYKTTRRAFQSIGGGFTGMKSTIISTADPEIGVSADACTKLELVLNHGPDHSLQAYQSCSWYSGFEEKTGENFWGSIQIDRQPNGPPYGLEDSNPPTCWWNPDPSAGPKKATWGYTGPACWQLESDEWMTFQVGVDLGTWQPDRTGEKTSRFRLWAAHENEPQVLVIDVPFYADALPEGRTGRSDMRAYGKVWLLPFMTGKDPAESHPTGYIWYDELIVSTEFIGDPN